MNTSRWGRVGPWLVAALVVGLLAVVAAILIPDRATADLGGTSWLLTAYGPAEALAPAGAVARIDFEDNSRFSGATGCNQFSGHYRAEAGRVSAVSEGVAFTTRDCDPASPEGAQDAFFRAALVQGAAYQRAADRLTLRFDNGQTAEYVSAPQK